MGAASPMPLASPLSITKPNSRTITVGWVKRSATQKFPIYSYRFLGFDAPTQS
jgi:hypothetical protein